MSRSWIVGGALRDELLGREVTDIDIAVEGDPEAAARELARASCAGRCSGCPRRSAPGGWWTARRARLRLRAAPGRRRSRRTCARRDFTVNAMARPREGGELIDPLGGRADLEARTLRVLGPEAYESDPLRPLRLARFAAELGFAPDPETERLTAAAAAARAGGVGRARVRGAAPARARARARVDGLALADRLGLLARGAARSSPTCTTWSRATSTTSTSTATRSRCSSG